MSPNCYSRYPEVAIRRCLNDLYMVVRRFYCPNDIRAYAAMMFRGALFAKLINILPRGKRGERGDFNVSNIICILEAGIAKEGFCAKGLLSACCEVGTRNEKRRLRRWKSSLRVEI